MLKAGWRFVWGKPTMTDDVFRDEMGWESEMPECEWRRLIHKEDIAGVLMDWNAAYHRRRDVMLKFRMLDMWGEYRWIISAGYPDPSGDGYNGFFLIAEKVADLVALN